jgi:hypothetical protein
VLGIGGSFLKRTELIRISPRGDIWQGRLNAGKGGIVGISRFFYPVWVRISGGWRGWREGMGDFPDITEAGAAAGERSGSGAGNTGAASEHRFRRLVGRRLSHAVIGKHQPRRGLRTLPAHGRNTFGDGSVAFRFPG